jgi:hypothetical protein
MPDEAPTASCVVRSASSSLTDLASIPKLIGTDTTPVAIADEALDSFFKPAPLRGSSALDLSTDLFLTVGFNSWHWP